MSFRAWLWVSGICAVLLSLIPVAYTWLVFTRVPAEKWSWGHQYVATFFSVGFAFAVGVWLYSWQAKRSTADRILQLRAMQITDVFNTWELIGDEHLQTVELPDGSKESVVLTFLQPAIYEDSVKSGLFGVEETLILSRLSAISHVYNDSVQSLMPVLKIVGHMEENEVGTKHIEELRGALHNVQGKREEVVNGGEKLLKLWTLREVRKALAVGKIGSRENPDARVVQLIDDHLPKMTPPSYKATLYAKLEEARIADELNDDTAVCALLDEIIEEANALSGDKIDADDADEVIAAVEEAKEERDCP